MATFGITAFENTTRGDRYAQFRIETSRMERVTDFLVEAGSAAEAAEEAFRVGNHQTDYEVWPSDRRSMSVGDVVLVTDLTPGTGWIRWFAVADMGFTDIGPDPVLLMADAAPALSVKDVESVAALAISGVAAGHLTEDQAIDHIRSAISRMAK